MMLRYALILILIVFSWLFPASIKAAVLYYTNGHADIGIGYEDGELFPFWHGTTGGGSAWNLPFSEYAPEEVVALISNKRNAGSNSSSYLGVATGTSIYVAGLINFQPWLGFGAEELDPGDWIGDFTIELTHWLLPAGGNFALYTTNGSGTTTADIFLSTYDPGATNDPWGLDMGPNVFGIGVGGHDHYQFGFTSLGYYEMTLKWTGHHVTGGPMSVSGTFGFLVAPEPSRMLFIGIGLTSLFMRRSRKPM